MGENVPKQEGVSRCVQKLPNSYLPIKELRYKRVDNLAEVLGRPWQHHGCFRHFITWVGTVVRAPLSEDLAAIDRFPGYSIHDDSFSGNGDLAQAWFPFN